ncbi:MAG: PspC domain-containing protein [Bacillota bacterium]
MTRRLYRSTRERMFFGVAGGMADYFDIDPVLVRLGWVLIGLVGGLGILAYFLCAIFIPENPGSAGEADEPQEQETGKCSNNPAFLGLVLVGLGLIMLLKNLWPWFDLGRFWPIILVVLGVAILGGSFRRDG